MEKYRQYRMMKKIKKLLNAPARKESYTPSNDVYMSNRSLNTEDNVVDPNRRLRMTQVEVLTRLLLQQISRIEELYAGRCHEINNDSNHEIDETCIGIEILFEELDRGVLLTEAEKAAQRLERANSRPTASYTQKHASVDLGALGNQIKTWQQEKIRRKKRSDRLERSIRELSLNVNDVRCAQILRDRKTSVAALESTIDHGIVLLKDVFREVEIAWATHKLVA